MTPDIFAPGLYAETWLPLDRASTLPWWCYGREMEALFCGPESEWLCVGREDQIREPGDFITVTLVGKPIILVRDQDRTIRAHSAVCRHRGAIVASGAGHCRSFVCPYHSWTYSLSGELVATPGNPPPMAGTKGFDRSEFGLEPIRVDVWAGFIFVTFSSTVAPLRRWLGDLPEFVGNYDLAQMRLTHSDTFEVECNWKVWLENAFENYHVATLHRKYYDPSTPQSWEFEETEGRGPYEAMFSRRSIAAYTGSPSIPGLSERQRSGLYHIWLKPSLQLILTPTYVKYRQYFPEGPEKFRLVENWTFPSATIERDDFSSLVGPGYYEKYADVIHEDMAIVPNVQAGMRSGSARRGRYSLEEYIVHRIATYVVGRVVGPARDEKRLAAE
jgi:choline monooxygenase